MNRDSKMGVLGLLAGAAIGTTIGILFAPQSGKDTRKAIKQRAKKARKDLSELVDKVRSNGAEAVAEGVENAGREANAKAKRAAETIRQNGA